jgi:diguanylate cyclase (GGDEF)-like protein
VSILSDDDLLQPSIRLSVRLSVAALGPVLLLLAAAATSAFALTGQPVIQRFIPDLDVYPSAYAVVQDVDGIVYVGAADGLLSFDGSQWAAYTEQTGDFVRSLALDPASNRLYVGGVDLFGYFETPVVPEAEFVDLSARVAEEDRAFADVWTLIAGPEGVFFQALNHVFRYDPANDALQTFRHPGRFGAMARFDDRVVLQYRGEGLRAWSGDGFAVLPGTESLTEQVFSLVPLADGGALTLARDGRWQRVDESGVHSIPVPDDLPASSEFNAAIQTADGRIAMGSRFGDVWFFDPITGAAEVLRASTDWIAALAPSVEGGLIIQTDHETLHVRWPSQWTRLGPEDGLTGIVHEVLEWRGRWIVISNAGALAWNGDAARFEPVGWTNFEAWDLQPLGDGSALFADSYVLKWVDENGVRASIDEIQYPRMVLPSRHDPALFYIGTEFGLAVIRRAGDRWIVVKGNDAEAVLISSMIELDPGELFVGTDADGIQRLRLDETRATIVERTVFDGPEIDYGTYFSSEVMRIGGAPHAVTMGGLWRLVDGELVRGELPGLEPLRKAYFLDLVEAPDGTLYALDDRRLFRFRPPNVWHEMDIAPLLRGVTGSLSFDRDGRMMVGMLGALSVFDPSAQESSHPGLTALLRSVTYTPSGSPARSLALDREHVLEPEGGFGIQFKYALPGLDARKGIAYQARLRGFEPAFTGWSETDQWTYYDLAPGRYVFEARARDSFGRITSIEPFEFEVVPPWYRTPWAAALGLLLLVLVLAGLVWLLMRARVWRLEADRNRLSEMVEERTEALEAANRRLKVLAEVDELTGVANRRRLDTVLRRALADGARRHRPVAVALIDVDRFKPYNDQHGHLAGDEALKRIVGVLERIFDGDDQLVARFGGDEFVVVLPGIDRERAIQLAESARDALEHSGLALKFSIGIAIAGIGSRVESAELIDAADRQMYVAKKAGRDGVSATRVDRRP